MKIIEYIINENTIVPQLTIHNIVILFRSLDAASTCMREVARGCDDADVAAWEVVYHDAISATENNILDTCINVCALNPCHNGGICSAADNRNGFICTCPPTHLAPFCVGG